MLSSLLCSFDLVWWITQQKSRFAAALTSILRGDLRTESSIPSWTKSLKYKRNWSRSNWANILRHFCSLHSFYLGGKGRYHRYLCCFRRYIFSHLLIYSPSQQQLFCARVHSVSHASFLIDSESATACYCAWYWLYTCNLLTDYNWLD